MARYPHLSVIDGAIWDAWLAMHAARIDHVWYDVWVGQHAHPDPDLPEQDRRIIQGTLAKRIDVVWQDAKGYTVCEIKPYINAVALGQAVQYHDLFARTYPTYRPVSTAVIGANVDADVIPQMESLRIKVYTVPESVLSYGA